MFDAYFSEMDNLHTDIVNKYKSIIKHKDTKQTSLSTFPTIEQYVKSNYNTVNFDIVNIYITSKKQFNKVGLGYAAGFFYNDLKSIFLLDQISTIQQKFKYKLDKLIFQNNFVSLSIEDVLIHELMHFISSVKRNNGSFLYKNMEEEFAYTACIKYYLSYGKSIDDIKNIIFPFCVSTIFEDKEKLNDLCFKCNISKHEFFNPKNAEIIASYIIKEAKKYVDEIIHIYNTKGIVNLNTDCEPYEDIRFSFLGEV